ncbi:MAG: hypothetical protein HXX15_08785 [Rhodopseudomonas sp.]|uniref:hypothetical protein n=1 Tax=Rhodopseudomonas sp. TaxID=1078 RepID=UPI001808EFCE|nr:hypothetical protein [Rhodopseudomonas sp.]NVN86173.1 hypothetical protein [Rhodopseudomonas sp.]
MAGKEFGSCRGVARNRSVDRLGSKVAGHLVFGIGIAPETFGVTLELAHHVLCGHGLRNALGQHGLSSEIFTPWIHELFLARDSRHGSSISGREGSGCVAAWLEIALDDA